MTTQHEKALAFRALHQRRTAFIIPNPWDAGSARLLTQAGFEALATTSAGYAFSLGRRDNRVSRGEMMAHVAQIVAATPLPVSADLENGYADAPAEVAETIRRVAAAGAVGCSIEDATWRAEEPLYPVAVAAARVRAAAEAARALPFDFTLTARAENYLVGQTQLSDVIARLQAYQEAGADVLYAPGLTAAADIASVIAAVDRPVNVLTMPAQGLDLAGLERLGVRRVSTGSALARAAYGTCLRHATAMRAGTLDFSDATPYADLMAMF